MKKKSATSRRNFLRNSVKLAAMLPLAGATAYTAPHLPNKPLKILILGGTSFLGPHQIAYALGRGHKITTFTRGKTKPTVHQDLFQHVESLVGDRENNLSALKGRRWDVVIDNSGRKVAWTQATAELLRPKTDMYVYISSISVSYPYYGPDFSESRKLVLKMPTDIAEEERPSYEYGIMKANSELTTKAIFGEEHSLIIRPHFMLGPADRTDRFTYWPARLAKGGQVLIPGKPRDRVQYIDVRDVANWIIRLIENKTAGTFNAAGPAAPMTMPTFVHGAHAAFSSPISYVQVEDYDFLEANGVPFVCPWVLPSEKYAGMVLTENQHAIKNGLTLTPLATTVRDTYDWWMSSAVSEERRQKVLVEEKGLMAREASILEKWAER